jgi:hypothetical protein
MKKIISAVVFVLISVSGTFAQTGVSPSPTKRTYNVGETGPANGIVFYDKGVFSDGWRYLEVAPVETEFNRVEWGAYTGLATYGSESSFRSRNISGTETVIGSGKRNTELIVGRLNQWGENGRAAQLCTSLNFNGYSDWFLPSKDELDVMYKNLKQKGLGDFSNSYYWSSSQYDNDHPWTRSNTDFAYSQKFRDGVQFTYGFKYFSFAVRAIRAF